MLWYAPSNYWVMAVYDSNLGGIDFFFHPDFHNWIYRSASPVLRNVPIFPTGGGWNTNTCFGNKWGQCHLYAGNFTGQCLHPPPHSARHPWISGYLRLPNLTVMPAGHAPRPDGLGASKHARHAFQGMHFFHGAHLENPAGRRPAMLNANRPKSPNAGAKNTASWTNLTLNPGDNPLSGISGQLFDVKRSLPGFQRPRSRLACAEFPHATPPPRNRFRAMASTNPLPAVEWNRHFGSDYGSSISGDIWPTPASSTCRS